MDAFGGVTLENVIRFQTQIMMGAQFGRVMRKDGKPTDIAVACLRMGWNDAFRHTSENTKCQPDVKKDLSVLEWEERQWRKQKEHKEDHDDFISSCILDQAVVLDAFRRFVCARTTEEKIQALERDPALKGHIGQYKKTDGDRQLCFGHFQKMFNIAMKLFACLYLCRSYLGLEEDRFDQELVRGIAYAHCPIDSLILRQLSEDSGVSYTSHAWSHYGTDGQPVDGYKEVQDAIAKLEPGTSNLHYDFTAWGREKKGRSV